MYNNICAISKRSDSMQKKVSTYMSKNYDTKSLANQIRNYNKGIFTCLIRIDSNSRDYNTDYNRSHFMGTEPRIRKRENDSKGIYSNYPKPATTNSTRHSGMIRVAYDNYLINKR
jgi:hypothetical protein